MHCPGDGGGSSWRPIHGGAFFGTLMEGEETSCPWRRLCLTFRSHRGQPPGVVVAEAPAHRRRRSGHRRRPSEHRRRPSEHRRRQSEHRRRSGLFIPLYRETSCPAARLCLSVAADAEEPTGAKTGLVQISTAPASGRWKTRQVGPRPLGGIACPSARLCFAFDDEGDVLWSHHPRRGAWSEARAASTPLTALTCPSARLCVGIDTSDEVVWSTSPLGGSASWKSELLETDGSLTSVACPSPRACLVADTAGRLALGVRRGR